MQYSNPRLHATLDHWPSGRRRTTATFTIEMHVTRGQRATRITVDPKTGRPLKPTTLTYARQVRLVDGDDGRLYILENTGNHLSVMHSNMQLQQEGIWSDDPRFASLMALLA